MSTTGIVVLTSAALLCVAVAIVAVIALQELRRPPLKGRLDDLLREVSAKKDNCP